VTGDTRKAVMLGFWMIGLVLRHRVRAWARSLHKAREISRATVAGTAHAVAGLRRSGGDRELL
jgi:hypothetical protein